MPLRRYSAILRRLKLISREDTHFNEHCISSNVKKITTKKEIIVSGLGVCYFAVLFIYTSAFQNTC